MKFRLTVVIDIHAGNSNRGSDDAPDRYRTRDVRYAIKPFVVKRRMTTAGGV